MLIVSGGDLVGKSTFVKLAYDELNRRGYHHMPHHLTKPPANFDYYRDYLDMIHPRSIWDRFALDCLAYRQLDDIPCSMTPMKWSLVEAACRHKGGFQVVLTCHRDDTIRERYAKARHGQYHMYDVEHAVKVNKIFRDMRSNDSTIMRDGFYKVNIDIGVTTDCDDRDGWMLEVIDAYCQHYSQWTATNAG